MSKEKLWKQEKGSIAVFAIATVFSLFFIFLGKDETGNIELDTVNAATNSKEVSALTKPYDLPSN